MLDWRRKIRTAQCLRIDSVSCPDSQGTKALHHATHERREDSRASPIHPPRDADGERKHDDLLIARHSAQDAFRDLGRIHRPAQRKLRQMILLPHVPIYVVIAHVRPHQARTGNAHLHAQTRRLRAHRCRETDDCPFGGAVSCENRRGHQPDEGGGKE